MTQAERLELINSYRAKGKPTVSPTEAAAVLGCAPYSLNVAAKAGALQRDAYYFAGRNLRITLGWLESVAQSM